MMLHVTTGERKLLMCGCENRAHKRGCLAAHIPPCSARIQREGRELRDEWSLLPLPPKSNLDLRKWIRRSELFP